MFLRGKVLIDSAVGTFKKAAADIETGISHLQAEADSRQIAVSAHQARIAEIGGHVAEANTVLGNIKKIYTP